jgi:hypothetical protein
MLRSLLPPLTGVVVVTLVAAGCPTEVAAAKCRGDKCDDKDDEPAEPPRLFVDPPFGLGFDCVTLGCETERTLTVENRGGGIVRIPLVRLSVDTSTDFALRLGNGDDLPRDPADAVDVKPGEPVELIVTYTPSDGTADDGAVLLDWYDGALDFDDAVVVNVDLPLSSRELGSVAAAADTTRLNFGFVAVDDEAVRELVVRNDGEGGILEVGPVTLGDGTPPVFSEPARGDWGPHFVNPGDEVRIPVRFAPDAADVFLGELVVPTNDEGVRALTVAVAGTAVAEPRASLSATSLALGDIRVGTPRTETVVVTNTGGAPLVFTPRVTAPSLRLEPADEQTVAPLESATFALVWTPTTGGDFTAPLSLSTNDPTQANILVDVEGFANAPALTATPNSLDFGAVVQGWMTGAQTVRLANTGFGELTINSVEFEVGSSQQIILADVPALPIKLSPGEEPVSFSVFMNATAEGSQPAVVLVGSDTVDGRQSSGGVTRITIAGRVITCDEGCPTPNGEPSCATGSCTIATCDARFHDANRVVDDGCECVEDALSGGVRRDHDGACPGLNIGPLGDDCATVKEVRRSGNTLHAEDDVDIFFFQATDESRVFGCDGFGDSFGVRLRLEGAPAGMRLCAVQQASGTGCGGENQRRCVNAGSDLFFGGGNQVFGGSDTSDFTVWVEWADGAAPQCGSYTLFVKGNDG